MGATVVLTSTSDGRGTAELRELLRGRLSLLAGQSVQCGDISRERYQNYLRLSGASH